MSVREVFCLCLLGLLVDAVGETVLGTVAGGAISEVYSFLI